MWDTVPESRENTLRLSHEMPCPRCGHATHHYLPCSDRCDCVGARSEPVATAYATTPA